METNEKQLHIQLQNSLIAIKKLKEANKKLTNKINEPVAITGMACILPGNIESPGQLWEALVEKKDLVGDIPGDRWDVKNYFNENPDNVDTYYVNKGGFLNRNIKEFDSFFFNISPGEAKYLDPQQRLLLEACYQAFENANITATDLKKNKTGVFIGISSFDNASRLSKSEASISAYAGTGNTLSGSAGRIAHTFGLNGPALSIDTACSSSLVAMHQACSALRNGECTQAVVGGVNIMLSPEVMVNFCQAKMLSPDGRCKTFDESANGYIRGEGIGVIILKPLSEITEEDNVLAVIKGTAINHDGKSAGLTVPNSLSQQAVFNQALKNADIQPDDIQYIECHGTGTSLGDPIEYESIAHVYGNRNTSNPLYIGSLKTNIGHLEAAAGISAVIKAVLCLHHKKLAPSLHFNKPNPHIPWNDYPNVKVVTEYGLWDLPGNQTKRRAGVSSFGFTGTNAHIILEEATSYKDEDSSSNISESTPFILTISAKSPDSLIRLKDTYHTYLGNTGETIQDICYTSTIGRNHFHYRTALTGCSKNELIKKLENKKQVSAINLNEKKIVFLFTGQGSQYHGMGKDLFEKNNYFKEQISQCGEILDEFIDIPLTELLFNNKYKAELNKTNYAQPALFSLEYSIAKLLIHLGARPHYVLGHSLGEITAACIANVFDLHDALKFVSYRGKYMQNAPGNGKMYSIETGLKNLKDYLNDSENISVAAINSEKQTVISGEHLAIENIIDKIKKAKYPVKQLNVSHAFHSGLMNGTRKRLLELLSGMKLKTPTIDIISTISGHVEKELYTTAEYWADQVVLPVNFYACLKSLKDKNVGAFIETGPQPVLLGLTSQVFTNELTIPVLKKDSDSYATFLNSIAELYQSNINILWNNLYKDNKWEKVVLPNYQFQYEENWINTEVETISKNTKVELSAVQELLNNPGFNEMEKQVIAKIVNHLKPENQKKTNEILSSFRWQAKGLSTPASNEVKNWLILEHQLNDSLPFKEKLKEKGEKFSICTMNDFVHDPNAFIPQNDTLRVALFYDFSSLKISDQYIAEFSKIGLSFLKTIQELEKQKTVNRIKTLAIVCINGQKYEDIELDAIHENPVNILGKTTYNELITIKYKGIHCINLKADNSCNNIYNDIITDDKECTVFLNNKGRFVLKLTPGVKLCENSVKKGLFDPDKIYLITGGTGALGLQLADYMIDKGAKQILLASRSGSVKSEHEAMYQKLQDKSKGAECIKLDISVENEVSDLFAKIKSSHKPLGGIFHLAGVLSDGSILKQNENSFSQVIGPKVKGAFYLHKYSKDQPVDYFVLFSSVSALLGAPGQINYSYANAFLNSMTEYRRLENLPCLSVNWGPVAGAGMAKHYNNSETGFLHKIDLKNGCEALFSLMSSNISGNYCISDFNIEMLTRLSQPLFSDFGKVPEPAEKFIDRIKTMSKNQVLKELSHYLKDTTSDYLEMDREKINEEVPLINYGIDSLMAIKIKNKIYSDMDIDIDISLFMSNPSLNQIKEFLIQEIELKQNDNNKINLSNPEEILVNLDNLSEEEIDGLLNAMQ
jgi:acyl transferase domain-containing protein/short-subunit dehydrogenase/acyl carrier protein